MKVNIQEITTRSSACQFPTGRHDGVFVRSHEHTKLELQIERALYSALERGDETGVEITRGELVLLNIALRRGTITLG